MSQCSQKNLWNQLAWHGLSRLPHFFFGNWWNGCESRATLPIDSRGMHEEVTQVWFLALQLVYTSFEWIWKSLSSSFKNIVSLTLCWKKSITFLLFKHQIKYFEKIRRIKNIRELSSLTSLDVLTKQSPFRNWILEDKARKLFK